MAIEFGFAEWDEALTHLPTEVQNRIGPLFQFGVFPSLADDDGSPVKNFAKRKSVHTAAIHSSRIHRVQPELVLSIGCHSQKLGLVRHRLRAIGAQRLDQA
jgi:hypothetical protein